MRLLLSPVLLLLPLHPFAQSQNIVLGFVPKIVKYKHLDIKAAIVNAPFPAAGEAYSDWLNNYRTDENGAESLLADGTKKDFMRLPSMGLVVYDQRVFHQRVSSFLGGGGPLLQYLGSATVAYAAMASTSGGTNPNFKWNSMPSWQAKLGRKTIKYANGTYTLKPIQKLVSL